MSDPIPAAPALPYLQRGIAESIRTKRRVEVTVPFELFDPALGLLTELYPDTWLMVRSDACVDAAGDTPEKEHFSLRIQPGIPDEL